MAAATSDMVEIRQSPFAMLGLLILGVIMTALSALVALRWVPDAPAGSFIEFVGYVGATFFALCTGIILWRLLTVRGPVVTIGPEGIRDTRVAAEFIPWNAIAGITTWGIRGQKVMVLAIDPAVESRLTLTRIARWSRGPNRALGADGLCVTAQGLRTNYDSLLDTTSRYLHRYSASGSVTHASPLSEAPENG